MNGRTSGRQETVRRLLRVGAGYSIKHRGGSRADGLSGPDHLMALGGNFGHRTLGLTMALIEVLTIQF